MTDVSRETSEKLKALVALIIAENANQNLVAASTIDAIWQRHIADSLQLLDLAGGGKWLDIGTGGGFPGLVVAIGRLDPVILVEPRGRRADFLKGAAEVLKLDHVTVLKAKAEAIPAAAAKVISARAVAPLATLLGMTYRHAGPDALWLLPKGRLAADELAIAQATWHGDFRLVPSRTDPEASIVMIRDLAPRPYAGAGR